MGFWNSVQKIQDKTLPLCSMIVAAAGASTRMEGQDKMFARLGGSPVLMRTLCAIDRAELVSSLRAMTDNREVFYCIPRNAGFVVCPEADDIDILFGRRGCAIVNHKLRTGYLQRNPEMNNRLEWICPLEDNLKVPVTHDFVVLLTEPLTDEEAAKCLG